MRNANFNYALWLFQSLTTWVERLQYPPNARFLYSRFEIVKARMNIIEKIVNDMKEIYVINPSS